MYLGTLFSSFRPGAGKLTFDDLWERNLAFSLVIINHQTSYVKVDPEEGEISHLSYQLPASATTGLRSKTQRESWCK